MLLPHKTMLPVPAVARASSMAACHQAVSCLASVLDQPGDPEVHARLRRVQRALVATMTLAVFAAAPGCADAKMYEWTPRRHHKRLGQIREEANQMILNQARPRRDRAWQDAPETCRTDARWWWHRAWCTGASSSGWLRRRRDRLGRCELCYLLGYPSTCTAPAHVRLCQTGHGRCQAGA